MGGPAQEQSRTSVNTPASSEWHTSSGTTRDAATATTTAATVNTSMNSTAADDAHGESNHDTRISPNGDSSPTTAAAAPHADNEDMSVEELLYSTASFHAIVKPVALTMILTALCVIYINTPETFAATQQQLSSAYVAFEAPEDASNAEKVGLSVTNALIIVSVICVMTFVIVLLYKYHCLKLLIGYMVLASAALLGFIGGNMFAVAIDKYNLAVDQFTYYFTLWNFAAVGTASIFSPWGGFPTFITQGYLICTAVILAWQLSALDPWTSWALLVMLALYDLCAVLTPCGPLKALVNLMSQDDSPDMPGLLYEAQLPSDARRPRGRRRGQRQERGEGQRSPTTSTADMGRQQQQSSSSSGQATTSSTVTHSNGTTAATATTTTFNHSSEDSAASTPRNSDAQATAAMPSTTLQKQQTTSDSSEIEMTSSTAAAATITTADDEEAAVRRPLPSSSTLVAPRAAPPQPHMVAARLSQTTDATTATMAVASSESQGPQEQVDVPSARQRRPRASLPFAIAKLYKLPIESEEPERRSDWTPLLQQDGGDGEEQQNLNPNELLARQYTPQQLKTAVVAIFPRNGGRIDTVAGPRYIVKDRHGNIKRILLLDEQGRVLEERQRTPEEEREEERQSNTIKLGLGDFIFYSVLVSKAVLYSFTTFVACFLVILAGLGMTLVLLAVYHKALPALPISIMLGVIFYVATRGLIEPWFEAILITPYYV